MTRAQRQLCREFAAVIRAGGLRLKPIAKRMGISRSYVSLLKDGRRPPTAELALRMREVIAQPIRMRSKKGLAKPKVGA